MALLNTFIHETLPRRSFHPDCVVARICIIQGFDYFCFVTFFLECPFILEFLPIYIYIHISQCLTGFLFVLFFYGIMAKLSICFFFIIYKKSCPFFIYIILNLFCDPCTVFLKFV